MLAEASEDTISVVAYTAPWCRACKAFKAKMDYVAGKWPKTRFYRVEYLDNLQSFFAAQNVTQTPFVEVYLGSRRLEALVMPPNRVRFLNVVLNEARARLRTLRPQLARRRVLMALKANRVESSLLERERQLQERRWHLVGLFINLAMRQRGINDEAGLATATERHQAEFRRHQAWKDRYTERKAAIEQARQRLERRQALLARFCAS